MRGKMEFDSLMDRVSERVLRKKPVLSHIYQLCTFQVVETWEGMKFQVIKYVKGTQDRGFVLGKCLLLNM